MSLTVACSHQKLCAMNQLQAVSFILDKQTCSTTLHLHGWNLWRFWISSIRSVMTGHIGDVWATNLELGISRQLASYLRVNRTPKDMTGLWIIKKKVGDAEAEEP